MKESIERMVWLLAYMYGKKAELVADLSEEQCYLFFDGAPQDIQIYDEDVNCLIYNDIIEPDGGCYEEGHETIVYTLTENSQVRIREILKNKKLLLLKE
jgi:hypothetical protein